MKVINGASTTSRSPSRMLTSLRALGVDWETGKIKLEDERFYTDWQAGLHGAIFPPTDIMKSAVIEASYSRIASIVHQNEYIAAEMLAQLYPQFADYGIRWMCNGSDPCSAAVKLARAYTRREAILSYGYHGFGGTFASPPTDYDTDDNRRGTLQAQRDYYKSLEWLGNLPVFTRDCAAVIVECPPVDGGRERASEWLNHVADEVNRGGALFVLDEVVTGFRYGPDGATGYYQLGDKVDLCCFGKTIGNGQPVSALVGRQEIMELLTQGVHYSATFFGHPFGLAAAIATMRQLQEAPPWTHLYRIGDYLKKQWNSLGLPWEMVGHPTRPVLNGPDEGLDDLRRYCFARGHIVVKHPWLVSTATTADDVDSLVDAVKEWQNGA